MNLLKKTVLLVGMTVLLAAPVIAVSTPTATYAKTQTQTAAQQCEKTFLGIHPWFRGLTEVINNRCSIVGPGQALADGTKLELSGYIWRIALNVIEIILGIIGYIAFFFIIYGGFQFLTGGGNPGQVEKARKTILNAVIGLVIALSAVALVNLVFTIIG